MIRTQHHTLVYDTGPSWRSGGAAADITLIPVLRRLGVRRVDRLVVSHGDDDHAGGAPSLERALPVMDRLGDGGRVCLRGESWSWDGVSFSILHPPDRSWEGNDGSCVVLVETSGIRLLLTGDLEALGEASLIQAGALPGLGTSESIHADVVVAPHHGSATSSSRAFVEATSPRLLVVSAGRGNRWKFPRIEVVQRWQRTGTRVLVSGRVGAVSLSLDPTGLHWTTELQRAPWPWRAYGMMREPET